MENLLLAHWFEMVETLGVVGGLFFTAHTIRKDERARQITNLIAISARYDDIWKSFYIRPELARVLKAEVDLKKHPVTIDEWLFVKMLILHLDTVYRAIDAGMFVRIEGVKSDIRSFISLPIPKTVWGQIKPFQGSDFVEFVESAL